MITIGEFYIIKMSNGKIWIRHESGEGGEFDEKQLAVAVAEFYAENF